MNDKETLNDVPEQNHQDSFGNEGAINSLNDKEKLIRERLILSHVPKDDPALAMAILYLLPENTYSKSTFDKAKVEELASRDPETFIKAMLVYFYFKESEGSEKD
ncbi:MAG TPA: hypothetical protein VF185_02360 [Patescibacteria group bacterium]